MPDRPRPLDARVLPRFSGVRTFARLPHTTDLDGVDVAVVGIPFDTGTSFRSGARFGPEGIRSASALLRPYNPVWDVDLIEALAIVDYGDAPVAPGDTIETYKRVEAALEPIVAAGVLPFGLGGDHSVTLAEMRVLAARYGPLAVVQFDSHTDTWDEYFGQKFFHGTTFLRAVEEGIVDASASVQAGMRGTVYGTDDLGGARELGFTVIPAEELRSLGADAFGDLVRKLVADRPLFLSFDVDFLDPAVTPGTGTPEIGGFSSAEALAFLRSLKGLTLTGADVVEVAPAYDSPGQQTSILAANVVWELLALHATGRA